MKYLLDTCVLSESTKERRDRSVVAWLSRSDLAEQYVSALTIGELRYGVERLTDGRKRRELHGWVETIQQDYAGRIVPLDLDVATRWAQLRAIAPSLPVVDAQLAATALTYDFAFVTRNEKHFRFGGLLVINPWES